MSTAFLESPKVRGIQRKNKATGWPRKPRQVEPARMRRTLQKRTADRECLRRNNTGKTASPSANLYRLRLIFTSKDCATYVPLVLIQVLVPIWEASLVELADEEEAVGSRRAIGRRSTVRGILILFFRSFALRKTVALFAL